MKKTLIRNATIVNEGEVYTGSVLIEGEEIKEIFRSAEFGVRSEEERGRERERERKGERERGSEGVREIIDASGKILIPGVIDDQVHFRDPGLTHKGDIYSESRAAAAGGVTSYMEMPNTKPQTITAADLKNKQEKAARESAVNFSFYFGATNDNIDEILAINPEEVCGLKVFMGSSTGNMLVDNEESLREIFKNSPVLVACHCEDETTVKSNLNAYIEEYGEDLPVEYHPLIRSREACYKSSSFAVKLAKKHGTRLHILHLSTAEEMELFDNNIKLEDKKITAEVCVHHLWFDDSAYKDKGNLIKWNPAIKKKEDRESLIEAVINDKIDIVATDHAPHTMEEKQGIYTRAFSGGPMVQHSLVAMLELWHNKIFSLETIVEKMCHNPAILFGVNERGFIRQGYKADLCLIDPDSPWTVHPDNILYKCGWSPMTNTKFTSKVNMTIVNGNIVWDGEKIHDDIPGQLLTFTR